MSWLIPSVVAWQDNVQLGMTKHKACALLVTDRLRAGDDPSPPPITGSIGHDSNEINEPFHEHRKECEISDLRIYRSIVFDATIVRSIEFIANSDC
jgi:hypothetical protein